MLKLLIVLIGLYLLAIRCRNNHPGLKALQGFDYAHRGLHGDGVPENSLAAFRAAVAHGYGAELDVHLLKDGNLAVMHDSLLNRTTGQPGRIEDLTTDDLPRYHLQGTDEAIPLLSDVLDIFEGKTPLILELKAVDGNHARLTETACRMLEGYKGVYCMESFDPRCIYWLKKHRPQIIRGQLAEDSFRFRSDYPDYIKFLMTHLLTNFLTLPDFVAYKFADRGRSPSPMLCRKLWKAQGVSWTLRTPEDYKTAKEDGWLPIFEGFRPDQLPEAAEAPRLES